MNTFKLFNKLNRVIQDEDIRVLKPHARQIELEIQKGNSIDIAVLGEFKVGKSSFINSFIGMDILPTGVIPVTSVITRIHKGEKENAIVHYENGKTEIISFGDIAQFVSESINPNNEKQVETLEIQLSKPGLPDGLHLVDTPGLGSFWEHNTKTTKQWFCHVGVAIICISTERPLSENEIKLIRAIVDETPEVVILLTKTDLFSESEIQKIESYIRESLRSEFRKDFRVFRYSLKNKTVEYKNIFDESVIKPLGNELDKKHEKILNHKIQTLFGHCLAYLEISRVSALHSENERKKLRKEIFDKKINQSFVAREMALVLTDELNGIRDKILAYLLPEQHKIGKTLKQKFKMDSRTWKGNLSKRTRTFEQWMKEELTREMIGMAEKHHNEVVAILEGARSHFRFFVSTFRNSLKNKIKETLGTDMHAEDLDIHYLNIKKPNILVSWTFESHIDLLWFLFPMAVFGKVFNSYFEKQISREIEINIYRMASNLNGTISKTIKDMKEQAQIYIANELITIENILSKPETENNKYGKIIGDLQKSNHDESLIK
ncbi:MAG: hypothetical protein GXO89_01265 [Chlorobi bacterium]|nr:hypothetical protein [Chlorobiota bacterium]